MKRVLLTTLLMLAMLGCIGCGTTIKPGFVGIKVNSWGSQRGVSDYPVSTGRVYYNPWTTSVIEYPTFVQTAIWTQSPNEGHPNDESITFTNTDNMTVNADVSLSYSVESDKVPAFYVKFRLEDIDKFTHGFLRNITRDKFNEIGGKYNIEKIMGDNGPFLQQVRDAVQTEVAPYGVHIEQLGFIGAPRPPDSVVQSINAKIQATQLAQQKENEVMQAKADAQKLVAEAEGKAKAQITIANGDAEANRVRSASITENILKMRSLENQHDAIWRWNGSMPSSLMSSGGNGHLLFNIPAAQQ